MGTTDKPITAKQASNIVQWITTGEGLSKEVITKLGNEAQTITNWRKGFTDSITFAGEAKDIAMIAKKELTDIQAKSIAWVRSNCKDANGLPLSAILKQMPEKLREAFKNSNVQSVWKTLNGMSPSALKQSFRQAAKKCGLPVVATALLSLPEYASAASRGFNKDNLFGVDGVPGAAVGVADEALKQIVMKDTLELAHSYTTVPALDTIANFLGLNAGMGLRERQIRQNEGPIGPGGP